MTRPAKVRHLAHRFMIWRFGTSMNWICSYRDIAAATGIDEKLVAKICRDHGYKAKRRSYVERDYTLPVDRFISGNRPFRRASY